MNETTPVDRGQVGIGTLIVFIAMVLVAAIAAGVLINTAGFLQTQAEATGEESAAQVTDNVQAVTSVGITNASSQYDDAGGEEEWFEDNPDDNDIVHVELTIQKSPGAGAIDMSAATIEYLNQEAETLTHNGTIDPDEDGVGVNGSSVFGTQEIRGSSGDDVLDADDDRLTVFIPLGTLENDAFEGSDVHPLVDENEPDDEMVQPDFIEEGDDVELQITTAQGSQTPVSLRAPDIISDDPAVAL